MMFVMMFAVLRFEEKWKRPATEFLVFQNYGIFQNKWPQPLDMHWAVGYPFQEKMARGVVALTFVLFWSTVAGQHCIGRGEIKMCLDLPTVNDQDIGR